MENEVKTRNCCYGLQNLVAALRFLKVLQMLLAAPKWKSLTESETCFSFV